MLFCNSNVCFVNVNFGWYTWFAARELFERVVEQNKEVTMLETYDDDTVV